MINWKVICDDWCESSLSLNSKFEWQIAAQPEPELLHSAYLKTLSFWTIYNTLKRDWDLPWLLWGGFWARHAHSLQADCIFFVPFVWLATGIEDSWLWTDLWGMPWECESSLCSRSLVHFPVPAGLTRKIKLLLRIKVHTIAACTLAKFEWCLRGGSCKDGADYHPLDICAGLLSWWISMR